MRCLRSWLGSRAREGAVSKGLLLTACLASPDSRIFNAVGSIIAYPHTYTRTLRGSCTFSSPFFLQMRRRSGEMVGRVREREREQCETLFRLSLCTLTLSSRGFRLREKAVKPFEGVAVLTVIILPSVVCDSPIRWSLQWGPDSNSPMVLL
jgi:hypothetical protein